MKQRMTYFMNKYRVETTRYKYHKYDGGMYFVTICTKDKVHSLGSVIDGEMILSEIGKRAAQNLQEINTHLSFAEVVQFVIMPNHVHALISVDNKSEETKGTLATVIRGFKSHVTKYANEQNIPFAWQARFHDRIVRDVKELNAIASYIENNPAQWQQDELYNDHQ